VSMHLSTLEIDLLTSLLTRARDEASSPSLGKIRVGDIVQIQPGIDETWETSLLQVGAIDGYRIRGTILRPHRGGCREAWYSYPPGAISRVGHAPFAAPSQRIRSWCYSPGCPLESNR